jgi:hypothetical protein
MPQAHALSNSDVGSLDIDDFLKGVSSSSTYLPNVTANCDVPVATYSEDQKFDTSFDDSSFPLGQVDEEDALWMGDFTPNNIVHSNVTREVPEHNVWAQ